MSLVLVAGLAVLALGALGASSASAAKVCKLVPSGEKGLWNVSNCEGTSVVSGSWALSWATDSGAHTFYCVLDGTEFTEDLCEKTGSSGPFKKAEATEEFPNLEGALLLSILVGHAATIPTTIHCTGGTFTGKSATQTLNTGTLITYTGCTVSAPASCEVGNVGGSAGTIKTEGLTGEQTSATSTLVLFEPETLSKFVEIEYKGSSCSLKEKKFPIKGSQMCKFNAGSTTTLAVLQLLNCLKSESALLLGTEKAEYEGLTHINFVGKPFWKV